MNLSRRTFILMGFVTLLLLFYVHEQVSIFQVSYAIEKKEREVARLSEAYKREKFDLARLRSPHVLSQRIKKLSLALSLPEEQEVVRILRSKAPAVDQKPCGPPHSNFCPCFILLKKPRQKLQRDDPTTCFKRAHQFECKRSFISERNSAVL